MWFIVQNVHLIHATEASKLIFKCDTVNSVATTKTASHTAKCALIYLCCGNRAGLVSCTHPDGSPSWQVFLHRCVHGHLCLCSDCTSLGICTWIAGKYPRGRSSFLFVVADALLDHKMWHDPPTVLKLEATKKNNDTAQMLLEFVSIKFLLSLKCFSKIP